MSQKRPPPFRHLLCTIITSAVFVAGCTDGDPAPDPMVDASVYEIVIADLVDRADGVLDDTEQLPVIYVETLGSDVISLETQVEVVARFEERYEIRFIDALDEAIDAEDDDRPVQPNSVLVGLGPVVIATSPTGAVEVRGELYLDVGDQRAYRYALEPASGESWMMLGSPEPIEPEGFVVS